MLDPGTRLGRYEVRDLLGAGGMGEVYRVYDAKLDRDVAVKVLPARFAQDAAAVERFEREARAVAALQHPNILAIHDFGIEDERAWAAVELLQGQTLRELLALGPVAPRQAVELARQLAEGLAAAHDAGIVHRDVKPENVFVTDSGLLKVLDFGLASAGNAAPADDLDTAAPTQKQLTAPGTVMGTVGYMSPEQVRGETVDHRSDVFSFGCVLYEMLTGRRAFQRDSAVETMTAVLREDPPDFATPTGPASPALERLARRCLEKSPVARFQSMHDLAFAVASSATGSATTIAPAGVTGTKAPETGGRAWKAFAATLLVATLGAFVAGWLVRGSGPAAPETRFVSLSLAPGTRLATSGIQPGPPVVSPDGRRIAFVAEDAAGQRLLWVRDLAAVEAIAITGTEGASYPFWSPDGEHLGFFTQRELLRVPAAGGSIQPLAEVDTPKGGTWSPAGVILLNPGFDQPLFTVPATGGALKPLTVLDSDRGEISHRFPQFLGNGRQFIFLARKSNDNENETVLASLDDPTSRMVVVRSPTNAVAVDDTILFRRGEALLAQSFDLSTGVLSGEPRVLVEKVAELAGAARMLVAARPGLLVYQAPGLTGAIEFVLVDRGGEVLRTLPELGSDNPALSPDGKTLAVQGASPEDGTQDILLIDLATGNREAFTFEPGHKIHPIWSPDGRRIAYASNTRNAYEIFVKPFARGAKVGGDEDPVRLVANDDPELRLVALDWSRNAESGAEYFVYSVTRQNQSGNAEIWFDRLDDEEPPGRIVESTSPGAWLSPDGRWLAYRSGVDARDPRIFVTDFPGARRRWEVTRGWSCDWVATGDEMICLDVDLNLLAIPVDTREGTFAWGTPVELFQLRERWLTGDGQQFVIRRPMPLPTGSTGRLELVLGWEALDRK